MTELNRRDVFRGVAATAALAGGAAAARPAPSPLARHRVAAVQVALQRLGLPGAACGLSPITAATVACCRSWDRQVHLTLADGGSGLCTPDAHGFAVAAAAQAAGRSLVVRYWGHDAAAELGVGRFAGVLLAFEAADLAATPDAAEGVA